MALRDLLVHLDPGERALVRLRLAVDLGRRHSSRLTALYVEEWSQVQLDRRKTAELGLCSEAEMHSLNSGIEALIYQAEQLLQSELERLGRDAGITTVWKSVDGLPSEVVPQYAHHADLCIIGQGVTSEGYCGFPEQMLLVSGRPVLFVPATGDVPTLGRHIVIAWDSSRAAARAVSDALPLIEHAEKTTLLSINSDDYIARHGAFPTRKLIGHLTRHGVLVHQVRRDHIGAGAIADTLLSEAHSLGADLLVAGAFGHARMREKLLGGVTLDLLARMDLPVMMARRLKR